MDKLQYKPSEFNGQRIDNDYNIFREKIDEIITALTTLITNNTNINTGDVDLSSPPPIGNIVPNSVETTKLTINGVDSTVGYGKLEIKSIAISKTLTDAQTNNIALQLHNNVKVLGIQLRNDTLIAGLDIATGLVPITTYYAKYNTGLTQDIDTAIALIKNTKINKFYNSNSGSDITTDVTDITVDSGTGNKFTAGGIISIICYYLEFTSITNIP